MLQHAPSEASRTTRPPRSCAPTRTSQHDGGLDRYEEALSYRNRVASSPSEPAIDTPGGSSRSPSHGLSNPTGRWDELEALGARVRGAPGGAWGRRVDSELRLPALCGGRPGVGTSDEAVRVAETLRKWEGSTTSARNFTEVLFSVIAIPWGRRQKPMKKEREKKKKKQIQKTKKGRRLSSRHWLFKRAVDLPSKLTSTSGSRK